MHVHKQAVRVYASLTKTDPGNDTISPGDNKRLPSGLFKNKTTYMLGKDRSLFAAKIDPVSWENRHPRSTLISKVL